MPAPVPPDPCAILLSLGIADADRVARVTSGSDTFIWRVTWRNQEYALRVFRPEQRRTWEREITAMQRAAAGGIPVPAIVRQGMWETRPVLLLSWIDGKVLGDQLRITPQRVRSLGLAFGKTQAAIHRLPAPPDWDPDDWIEWAGDEPELKARLDDLPSRKTALLHLDFHLLNVMVAGSQIRGVLDWANARAGDPRADFARTYTILRVEPYSPRGDSPIIAVMRRLLERAWRTGYQQAGGCLEDMALFYAWAGAVMIRDLSPRLARSDSWLEDQHLDAVRVWRDNWKRRAGIRQP